MKSTVFISSFLIALTLTASLPFGGRSTVGRGGISEHTSDLSLKIKVKSDHNTQAATSSKQQTIHSAEKNSKLVGSKIGEKAKKVVGKKNHQGNSQSHHDFSVHKNHKQQKSGGRSFKRKGGGIRNGGSKKHRSGHRSSTKKRNKKRGTKGNHHQNQNKKKGTNQMKRKGKLHSLLRHFHHFSHQGASQQSHGHQTQNQHKRSQTKSTTKNYHKTHQNTRSIDQGTHQHDHTDSVHYYAHQRGGHHFKVTLIHLILQSTLDITERRKDPAAIAVEVKTMVIQPPFQVFPLTRPFLPSLRGWQNQQSSGSATRTTRS